MASVHPDLATPRLVLYCRVSTEDQAERQTVQGQLDFLRRVQGMGNAIECGQHFARGSTPEITTCACNAKPSDPLIQRGQRQFDGTAGCDRIFLVRSLHHIIGQREIADIARKGPEMIEAAHKIAEGTVV